MNKIIFCCLILFSTNFCFSQEVKKDEKILYIIDGVPLINDPDDKSGYLSNEDIDALTVVTDKQKLTEAGYPSIDKIIYVTTKEYQKRPEDVKKTPTTKLMEKKNGFWFLKNASNPYTGRFIDYFLNGKIQGEGYLKNGIVDGIRTVYYQNGNKRYFDTYINGIEDGTSEEYFINGKIKQKGNFNKKEQIGLWQKFYSTGNIKQQTNFTNNKPILSKDETKFYTLQDKAVELMKTDEYKSAIKKLDEAEKINNKFSDLYFYRGTAKLDDFDFDNAIIDFDKAIELEPLYMEAISNRAFARLRKYEFKNSRTLTKTNVVTVLASKDKVEIPKEEQNKICVDLNKGYDLGDKKQMVLDAIEKYCK